MIPRIGCGSAFLASLMSKTQDHKKTGKSTGKFCARQIVLACQIIYNGGKEEYSDDCINQDILREFLIKNRSEVIDVLLTEYNEKKHMKIIRRDARAEGKTEGKTEGKAEYLLALLMNKGQVSEQLRTTIKAEEDVEVLDRWFAIAVKASSVEEFEEQIQC